MPTIDIRCQRGDKYLDPGRVIEIAIGSQKVKLAIEDSIYHVVWHSRRSPESTWQPRESWAKIADWAVSNHAQFVHSLCTVCAQFFMQIMHNCALNAKRRVITIMFSHAFLR